MKGYDSNSIRVLEGLEAVRVRPEMYIGSTGKRGLNHLVYEIVDNAVDEHVAGFGNKIIVSLNADNSCTVRDYGRGIPIDMHSKGVPAARVVFTVLHAGGKFDNTLYKTAGGLHGVGSSVVNALSSMFDVEICRDGKIHHDAYERGVPVVKLTNGLLPIVGKSQETGTKITFLPDEEIFSKLQFDADEIKERLHQTAYLNPSLKIEFIDKRSATFEEIEFYEPDGLSGFIQELNQNEDVLNSDIICFSGTYQGIRLDGAMQYRHDFHENILGFCNNIYTQEGGTHLTGFKAALTSLMNQYAKEIGILKEKDNLFTGQEIRSGLTAVIALSHPSPRFEGQTKTKLDNPDAQKACAKITSEQLTLFFDKNVETLKSVLEMAQKAARIRKAEEKTRANFLTKPRFSFDDNGKISNCESRDYSRTELFIVEGDSAGGSAKMARDRSFQAILPIRGKILNIEKASMDKVLANAEIRTIIHALGCGFSEGYGNDFDIAKLKYNKIIITTDADIDGSHIDTLLLTFFYRFMPELIASGHVYLAMPPLYKVTPQRGTEQYLYDDDALERYKKGHKAFALQRYKGLGEMNPEQLWETTLNPATRKLRQIQVEDAKKANLITATLMGNNVESRKDFIVRHADTARLDV